MPHRVAQDLEHGLEGVAGAGLPGEPLPAEGIGDEGQADPGCLHESLHREDRVGRCDGHQQQVEALAEEQGPHKPVYVGTELVAACLLQLVSAKREDVGFEASQSNVH